MRRAGVAARGRSGRSEELTDELKLLASLRSVSTPPASWTVMNEPTAMTIASAGPAHAQIVASSPRSSEA